jgi:hypothetical protein
MNILKLHEIKINNNVLTKPQKNLKKYIEIIDRINQLEETIEDFFNKIKMFKSAASKQQEVRTI